MKEPPSPLVDRKAARSPSGPCGGGKTAALPPPRNLKNITFHPPPLQDLRKTKLIRRFRSAFSSTSGGPVDLERFFDRFVFSFVFNSFGNENVQPNRSTSVQRNEEITTGRVLRVFSIVNDGFTGRVAGVFCQRNFSFLPRSC